MNRFVPFFLLQLTLLSAAEIPAPPRLNDATHLALTRNSSIKAARAKWNAMKARVPQAAAWDDLEIGADVERSGTTRLATFSDIEYMVSQSIPISGKNRVQARIAAAEAAAAFHEYRRVQLDVLARVKAAWYRLGNAHAQLALSRADVESLAAMIETSRVRYESGLGAVGGEPGGGIGEVLSGEVELGKVRELQFNLERRATEAIAELNGLLEQTASGGFATVTLPALAARSSSAADAERRAQENRPEIWIAKERAASAREQVELARRNWIPDPQLRVEARQLNGSTGIREYDTGIFFKVPWANREKYKAAQTEAEFNVESSRNALASAQAQARALVRTQLAKVETSKHHAEIYREKLIPLAGQLREAQRVAWEAGRSGLRDLIAAARSQRELEMQLVEHQADYLAAMAELDAIVGDFGPANSTPFAPQSGQIKPRVKPLMQRNFKKSKP